MRRTSHKTRIVRLHFWSATESFFVFTNNELKAIVEMQSKYHNINPSVSTEQPNKADKNDIKLWY